MYFPHLHGGYRCNPIPPDPHAAAIGSLFDGGKDGVEGTESETEQSDSVSEPACACCEFDGGFNSIASITSCNTHFITHIT